MAPSKGYAFSKHIGALCATRATNVYRLGKQLGIDPTALLDMINGQRVPTPAAIRGLARELDSDLSYLEKLAGEISGSPQNGG